MHNLIAELRQSVAGTLNEERAEKLPKIFDQFYQCEESHKQLGGTIEVVSKVGEGTAGAHPLPCLLFFADGQMCRFDSLLFQEQML